MLRTAKALKNMLEMEYLHSGIVSSESLYVFSIKPPLVMFRTVTSLVRVSFQITQDK